MHWVNLYAYKEKIYRSIDPTYLQRQDQPAHAVSSKVFLLSTFSLKALCDTVGGSIASDLYLFGPPTTLDGTSIITV